MAYKKEVKKNIFLFISTILIMLIVLELGLRIFFPQKLYNECYDYNYKNGSGVEVQLDSHIGWLPKTYYSSCRYQPDTNNKIRITHNSKGMRLDHEPAYIKKINTTRILLLGDSFIYGDGLDDSETITSVLQEILEKGHEVLSLSAIGYGTDQEYLLLKEKGIKYKPDIIILFFYVNDLTNNLEKVQNYAYKPRFTLEEEGSLRLENYPTVEMWAP